MQNPDLSLTNLFNEDLSSVSLKRPLLKPAVLQFTVTSIKTEPSKDGSSQNIVIEQVTQFDAEGTVPGETIPKGYKLTNYINLKPTDKNGTSRAEIIRQDLARFHRACGLTGPFGNMESHIGCTVHARVTVSSDANGVFDDSNRLRYVVQGEEK